MSACTQATDAEPEKTRAGQNTHSEYPPNDTDYTLIEVEFVPNGKRYAYFAPIKNGSGRKIKPGDRVRVDTGNNPMRRNHDYIKVVRVRNVLGTVVTHAGRDCKTIVDVQYTCTERGKIHKFYDERREEGSTIAALDMTHVRPTVDAFDIETQTALDLKTATPSILGADFSELELRVMSSLACAPLPDIKQDIYKQIAEKMTRDTEQRALGMPPALGMGYAMPPRSGKSITVAELVRQMQAVGKGHSLKGKSAEFIIFDDIPDALAYGQCASRLYRFNTIKPKEAPVELKINTVTYVNGQDVSKLTPEAQFELISQAENEIRRLSTLVNKPKAVAKRIAELEEGIAALVRSVDGDDAAPYKAVIETTDRTADDSADRG